MRLDVAKYYRDSIERRHNGEHPTEPERSVPFAMGPCVECGRRARLCSSAKCVSCHTAHIRVERESQRKQ